MSKVLVIDDNKSLIHLITKDLKRLKHEVLSARTLTEGMQRACSEKVDLVFLDLHLPDGNGLEILPRIKSLPDAPEVIIFTGYPSEKSAELAIQSGVWDYLAKPIERRNMHLTVAQALEYRQQKQNHARCSTLVKHRIIGNSPRMLASLERMSHAAQSHINVLITGETGTGKELFAQAIHENGPPNNKNLVVVDCSVLPDTLAESLLFGHVKGAFSGAITDRKGLIRQAHHGTLFLDEIGELPMDLQKKFLRVIQEKAFKPVGSTIEQKSDFRVISATNRDLSRLTASGEFRQDLLYRLSPFVIHLAPLRERLEDIEPLLEYYIKRMATRYQIPPKQYAEDFVEALQSYSWPGNVREFVNTIDMIHTQARHEPVMFARHLPATIRFETIRKQLPTGKRQAVSDVPPLPTSCLPDIKTVRENTLARIEREYFEQLMSMTGGDIREACRIAGIARSQLYKILKKYHISPKMDR
jgi:two-component system NtrC family response regulator